MHEGMGWWMVFGSVWLVLFWGVIIWAIVSLVSRNDRPERQGEGTPLDIARRRYARGDISREEFERLKADLS
jgi:putative membrane protein